MSKGHVIATAINYVWYIAIVIAVSDHFMIPASSGPMDILFSVGSTICRPDHFRLTDQTFECLTFIKNNAGFCEITVMYTRILSL